MKTSLIKPITKSQLQLLALMLGAALVSAPAFAADNSAETRGHFSKSDYGFAVDAATVGATEVELGKLATQKGNLPGVREFGQQMVTDHGKAGERLKQIASSQSATLPDKPTAKQQREIERLTALSGTEFDREYVGLMVKDHRKALKEFQSAGKKSDNTELKLFASETATVIEGHLAMAENLADRLKGEIKGGK